MKKLKTESLLQLIPLLLILAFFGSLCLAGSNVFAKEPEAIPLFELDREDLEGAYVTVNLDYIYGCYAYTETYENNKPTGKITEREYLIDANEYDFMCFLAKGDLMDQAEALLEQSDEMFYGERSTITADFRVSGYVREMKSDSIRLLKEAVDYSTLTTDEQDIYLFLILEPADFSTDPILLAIGLAFFGAALIMLIIGLSGHYQKPVQDRLRQYFGVNTAQAKEFLNYLIGLPKAGGLRIGAGYLLLRHGTKHYILDGNDILWAYQQTTTQKYMGIIPLGKTHAVVLRLADGKMYSVSMSDKKAKEQLQILLQQFPSVAVGYSSQLLQLYNSNPQELRSIAAAQRLSSSL